MVCRLILAWLNIQIIELSFMFKIVILWIFCFSYFPVHRFLLILATVMLWFSFSWWNFVYRIKSQNTKFRNFLKLVILNWLTSSNVMIMLLSYIALGFINIINFVKTGNLCWLLMYWRCFVSFLWSVRGKLY